jgi:hypothetical protein
LLRDLNKEEEDCVVESVSSDEGNNDEQADFEGDAWLAQKVSATCQEVTSDHASAHMHHLTK